MTEQLEVAAAAPVESPTLETLNDRRTVLQGEIERQQRARAEATLGGERFDLGPLRHAEDELEAFADAESELVRRERVTVAARLAAEREVLRSRVPSLVASWLAAIDDQEAAGRALIEAAGQANVARDQLETALSQLVGCVPTVLMVTEQETRRSRALCALLHQHLKKSHFGDMALFPGATDPSEPWAKAERQMAETIPSILNEVTNDAAAQD